MILNFLIIFLFLFEYIKSGVLEDCEIGNYCSSGACSIYGNCRFERFIRMNENSTNSICMCNRGYSSYDIDELNLNERSIYCCYKKKSQFTAFLLEICLGFGMGHFYTCRYIHGITKFIIFWFLALINSIFKKKIRGYSQLKKISVLILYIFWILYCADFFCFNFDYYLDGNKIPLI